MLKQQEFVQEKSENNRRKTSM